MTETVRIVVSQKGDADAVTVQEAVDRVPENNWRNYEIVIKEGTYFEKVIIPPNKPNIAMIGENRDTTVLVCDDYAGKPKPGGGTWGTGGSATLSIYADGVSLHSLTVRNSFDKFANPEARNTQAAAIYAHGRRLSFCDVRIAGRQDTLYANGGTQYYRRCRIEGDVDFIFGGARAVFEECDIVSLDRGLRVNGYVTAACTKIDQPYGFMFLRCRLLGDTAEKSVFLGRPWHPGRDPDAVACVLFRECELGPHIHPDGWTGMADFRPEDARLFEYRNRGPGVCESPRRRQLTDEEAARWTVEAVLDGWNPSGRIAFNCFM